MIIEISNRLIKFQLTINLKEEYIVRTYYLEICSFDPNLCFFVIQNCFNIVQLY